MTYEVFWYGRPIEAKLYREAEKIKFDDKNFSLWLQGRYFYEALCAASPLFLSLAPEGTTAQPYMEKPYVFSKTDTKKEQENKEKAEMEKGQAFMTAFAAEFNKRFRSGGENNGRTDN